ncbi:MAG TPA: hypothetical protein VG406_26915 [Isosphaeraceae bacterium]|nr:hypothetical protein [Isosphaeraceae bacterium]
MRSLSLGSVARWSAGALVALVAGSFCAPEASAAGCDHPTTLDGPAGHFELLAKAGALPKLPRRPASVPCSGPTCSNAPHAPSAPAPLVTLPTGEWGCLAESLAISEARPSYDMPNPSAARPLHRGPSVFHPPRTPLAAGSIAS